MGVGCRMPLFLLCAHLLFLCHQPLDAIRVRGNKFVDDETGSVLVLRGVSHSGSEYSCVQHGPVLEGQTDASAVAAIKSWGNNVVRIPLNEDCWLGINGVNSAWGGAQYQRAIRGYVDTITAAGMVTILDLHWTAPDSTLATKQDAMPDASHAVTFWSQVASAYANESSVVFELFNEPFPGRGNVDGQWACWRNGTCTSASGFSYPAAGMDQLVQAVRGAGAHNVIVLGALVWSNHLEGWVDNVPTDPVGQLGAVWHSYDFNACNQQSCWESTVAPVAARYPVVVTETGFKTSYTAKLWPWLEQHGISYLAWTWNTWANGQGLVSDYNGSPTSPWGTAWKSWLASVPRPALPGGSLVACIALCPSSPAAAYKACVGVCAERCPDAIMSPRVPRMVPTASAQGQGRPRPVNIVHIMADDVGWNDLSYKTESLSHSPNLDALAKGGVRLTNHHAFKVCAPSRSSFHTGRLPWQMGYYDNSAAAVPWLNLDSNRNGASLNFTLLPEALVEHGGYTAHAVGKWHLGHVTRAYTPTYRGYETFLGYYDAMTEDYWAHTHSTGANAPHGCKGPGLGGLWPALSNNSQHTLTHSLDNGTYESTLFGDRAVDIIEKHDPAADGPLFLYVAFHNEHDPHQAPRDAIDSYGKAVKSDTYKVTVAQVATMDMQVGRIVAALKRAGMLNDTVIGFSSDNGGPLDHANNWPRRGGKFS